MPTSAEALLTAFDGHDAGAVRAALEAGADAVSPIRGNPPIDWLLEQYHRTDALAACVRLLVARGATLAEPGLLPVILDDAAGVRAAAAADPAILTRRITRVSTFVSLTGATLLHVAAEHGCAAAATALLAAGADPNAAADTDAFGLNGHTPLFHTVNANANRSAPVMRLLLAAGADPEFRVRGLHWGRGFEWETTFFDVTPISFAQMGLLPQVHRREQDIYNNIRELLTAAGRPVPPLPNVPNRYLLPKAGHRPPARPLP